MISNLVAKMRKLIFALFLSCGWIACNPSGSPKLGFGGPWSGGGGGFPGLPAAQVLTSSGTFTTSSTTTRALFCGYGGGGGGGGGNAGAPGQGAGGGAGGGAKKNCVYVSGLSVSTTYTDTIGAGGTSGAVGTNGGPGGDSKVTLAGATIVLFKGASGGQATSATSNAGGMPTKLSGNNSLASTNISAALFNLPGAGGGSDITNGGYAGNDVFEGVGNFTFIGGAAGATGVGGLGGLAGAGGGGGAAGPENNGAAGGTGAGNEGTAALPGTSAGANSGAGGGGGGGASSNVVTGFAAAGGAGGSGKIVFIPLN